MMDFSDASRQFQWRDRCGLVWDVHVYDDQAMISWFARPSYVGYIGGTKRGACADPILSILSAKVAQGAPPRRASRHDTHGEPRHRVYVGSEKLIKECKRRGHEGIEGKLSSVDSDHFDKLKHFYEKLGFTVVFYAPEHPDYRQNRVGKIEMLFSKL